MLHENVSLDAKKVKKIVEIYYDMHIKTMKKVRAVYYLETNKGVFAFKNAKKMNDLFFIQQVVQHLHQQGFPRVPRIVPAFDGELIIQYKGDKYYMEEWLTHVKEVNPHKWDWLFSAGKGLAEFHQAIATFPKKQIPSNRVIKHSWSYWMYKQYRQVDKLATTFSAHPDFHRFSYELKTKCRWSIFLSEPQPDSPPSSLLCHGSLHNENIMIDSNHTTWLIDYERLVYDEKAKDLAQLLHYHFRYHRCKEKHIFHFLRGYQEMGSLEHRELYAMCARLIGSQRLFRTFFSIFNPYMPCLDKIDQLEEIMYQEKQKEYILRKMFSLPYPY